jgi:endo-1,4-beta-xylanase
VLAALAAVLLLGVLAAHRPHPLRQRAAPDVAPLRGADPSRFAGVAVRADLLADRGYAAAVGRLFDTVTPENELKWDATEPERGRFSFSAADRIVAFARAHGQRVRGHTLVWHQQNPDWLTGGHFSRAQLIAILRAHIRTVMRHYRGRIGEWDVVNEAVADTGRLRDSVWLRGIGPEYIALAFRFAREADPAARLVYNDYGTERPGKKAAAVYGLVAGLVHAHVPIDAVGFQTHVDATPIPGYVEVLRKFAALGVDVELTEVDVRLPHGAGAAEERAQARQYGAIAGGCRAVPRCRGIVFWGLDDADSWVPQAYPGFGDATLFDGDLHPKPAYAAVRRALMGP